MQMYLHVCNLQVTKYLYEILTYGSLTFTMDHPKYVEINQNEESIPVERAGHGVKNRLSCV